MSVAVATLKSEEEVATDATWGLETLAPSAGIPCQSCSGGALNHYARVPPCLLPLLRALTPSDLQCSMLSRPRRVLLWQCSMQLHSNYFLLWQCSTQWRPRRLLQWRCSMQ